MARKSIKILCQIDFPSEIIRIYDGSGVYVDLDGNNWYGNGDLSASALQTIQYAMAGELNVFDVWASALSSQFSDLVYTDDQEGNIIGSSFKILIQDCDEYDEPDGTDPRVHFSGQIIDVKFNDVSGELNGQPQVEYQVGLVIANRAYLRRLNSGAVLSDADQRARSAALNPSANPDRFCERTPLVNDRTLVFPRF